LPLRRRSPLPAFIQGGSASRGWRHGSTPTSQPAATHAIAFGSGLRTDARSVALHLRRWSPTCLRARACGALRDGRLPRGGTHAYGCRHRGPETPKPANL
jgi:hypothetical protein